MGCNSLWHSGSCPELGPGAYQRTAVHVVQPNVFISAAFSICLAATPLRCCSGLHVRLACRWSVVRLPDQACFIIRCKNLALNIRDCLSLCLSKETLKAVGPFYLVPMPGEAKDPTQGVNRQIPCRGLHTSLNHSCVSPKMGCLEYT